MVEIKEKTDMGLKLQSISINLPFGLGGINVIVTEAQKNVAWALYVELATRIAGVKLESGTGSAREALKSIHSLFETTRSVLRSEGPKAAEGPDSVGPIAIQILNKGLRPFLVKWHTELGNFEGEQARQQRKEFAGDVTVIVDESQWSDLDDFYDELEQNRQAMLMYIEELGRIAGVTD